MKLLLTSSGFTNNSIIKALQKMVDKPFSELSLAFIPTAANIEAGDKRWLIEDLSNVQELGLKKIDLVDISALPKAVWQERLAAVDILLFCGGNSFHLMYWLRKSGLDKQLRELLTSRVYVGISAGSIVATKNLSLSNQFKKEFTQQLGEDIGDEALGFVNFLIRPHLDNPHFSHAKKEVLEKTAKETGETMYGIDDETAIQVINDQVTVISEGAWVKFN